MYSTFSDSGKGKLTGDILRVLVLAIVLLNSLKHTSTLHDLFKIREIVLLQLYLFCHETKSTQATKQELPNCIEEQGQRLVENVSLLNGLGHLSLNTKSSVIEISDT